MPEFQNGASSRGDSDGCKVIVLRLADIKNRQISLEEPRELLISQNMIEKYCLIPGDILIIRVNGSADLVGVEVIRALRLGQCAEQVVHQFFVGFGGVIVLGFQLVTQLHQFIDFGDDAVLFGERWNRN